MKLLFRFFDPDEGRVLINGQNIKDLDLYSVRKVIGVVPQVNFPRCLHDCEDNNSNEEHKLEYFYTILEYLYTILRYD